MLVGKKKLKKRMAEALKAEQEKKELMSLDKKSQVD